MDAGKEPLYRHVDVALLRAAAWPLTAAPDRWPDPADVDACREWLDEVWSRPEVAAAIRQASPSLTERVDAIRQGRPVCDKQVRRATVATTGYLLRAVGRPTPFGEFAGVALATLGRGATVLWGKEHRPAANVDTAWLADVIERLEACPELVDRLDVVMNNLAFRRGGRLEVPRGPSRVTIRCTTAVEAARETAVHPIRFGVLLGKLAEAFPAATVDKVRVMLAELVQQGFLLTSLRAPFTVTDPLGHVLDRLHEVEVGTLASVASLVRELEAVHADLQRHNRETATQAARAEIRQAIARRTRVVSSAGRGRLAVHLRLDCSVQVPEHVAQEMARAAGVLLRLTRRPAGDPAWQDFHVAFLARYGTATLVPVADVVDPDTGLGYPAGYPGSVMATSTNQPLERDERLLELAWQAMADSSGEVVLSDKAVADMGGDGLSGRPIPPHVEVAGRVQATSVEALGQGDYLVTVRPARSAGTLTSRFTQLAGAAALEEIYRTLPPGTDGGVLAQMSFPPAYPLRGERLPGSPLPATRPVPGGAAQARRWDRRTARRLGRHRHPRPPLPGQHLPPTGDRAPGVPRSRPGQAASTAGPVPGPSAPSVQRCLARV